MYINTGDTSKYTRALFSLAEKFSPSIVFIDEVDLLLGKRSMKEHDASGNLKGEILQAWDGLLTQSKTSITVLGATNRPAALDEAVLRRFTRQYLFDLPTINERISILSVILKDSIELDSTVSIDTIASLTVNYSGSDLKELCKFAAMRPIKEVIRETRKQQAKPTTANTNNNNSNNSLEVKDLSNVIAAKPRPLSQSDFLAAIDSIKPTGAESLSYQRRFQAEQAANNNNNRFRPD